MSSMANVTVFGRLGKDPEVRTGVKNGKEWAIFSFSVGERLWDSKKKEAFTRWWEVSTFGQTKSLENMRKGTIVCANGEMTVEMWKEAPKFRLSCESSRSIQYSNDKDSSNREAGREAARANGPASDFDSPDDDDIPF